MKTSAQSIIHHRRVYYFALLNLRPLVEHPLLLELTFVVVARLLPLLGKRLGRAHGRPR